MEQHFRSLLSVSENTFVIAVTMSLLMAWLTSIVLDSRPIAALFFPGLVYGSLLSIHLCQQYRVLFSPDKEAHAAVAAGFGLIAALLTLLIVMRILNELWGFYVRSMNAHLASAGSGKTTGSHTSQQAP